MKPFVLFTLLAVSSAHLYAQVGIGTTTPKAYFNVATNKDVLFGQEVSGGGEKLIWLSSRGAFRAGGVTSTQWDIGQVGEDSFAAGYDNIASGDFSTALGLGSVASGLGSFASGQGNESSANSTVAIGFNLVASSDFALALGRNNTASGTNSTALGEGTIASGEYSTALGGDMSTNNKFGAFGIGDGSQNLYSNSAQNQMMMRFSGGYILYTTSPANQATAVGVKVVSGGNAWQTISDSTRKENFRLADGASFLQKISALRLGSWNYKGQDAHEYRHYGPMAQDFFAAFGHDALGTIGEDKSINQADFDGVNLIAIQALIKENKQLKARLAAFEEKERVTQARLAKLEALVMSPSAQATVSLKP